MASELNVRRCFALIGLSFATLVGCGYEPSHNELEYQLNPLVLDQLDEADAPVSVENQILFTLNSFFGTPAEPRLMVPLDWVDEGFDPNHPEWAADDGGSGEFSDEDFEAIAAGNEWRFRDELAAIAAGEYEEIGPIKAAPVLTADWDYYHQSFLDGDLSEAELKEEGQALFGKYYPSLADSAELYRQQCMHCHGVSGGGDGPTAEFLNPLPRDYRKGIFKFTALKDKARPRRADLARILEEGVYGTAMPSFSRFSRAEREGLADYVRLLSIRGEMEHMLTAIYVDEETLPIETSLETYMDLWQKWQSAAEKLIVFDGEVPRVATPEMLARGREIFLDGKRGNCFSCHGESALGNGPAVYEENEDGEIVPAFQDDWGHDILPRNLTSGMYRGGGRPIDIYRRVYAGINGTTMPAIGETRGADGELVIGPDDMWAVVHYVISLGENPRPLRRHGNDHAHGGEDSHGAEGSSDTEEGH